MGAMLIFVDNQVRHIRSRPAILGPGRVDRCSLDLDEEKLRIDDLRYHMAQLQQDKL